MNETATLLRDFGFTTKTAVKIARRAHQNDLTLADVQAWIDEAYRSRSIRNPRGFVRARIQDGDKMVRQPEGDPHITDRQRYQTQWSHLRSRPSAGAKPVTQTCKCGRVVYATRICPDCRTCPKCCTCELGGPTDD